MKIIWYSGILLSFLIPGNLFAERAQFWNLGFSNNSEYFAFSQFWINSTNSSASSELYVVDTLRNNFVSNGTASYQGTTSVSAGTSGRNASLILFKEKIPLLNQHNIDVLNQGRLIYAAINGTPSDNTVHFRDHATNNEYTIGLNQKNNKSGAAFSLNIGVNYANNTQKSVQKTTVGLPDYYRPGVYSYRLSQVIVAPDNTTLVLVVEQELGFQNSNRIRYMIETLALDRH